MRAFQPSTGTPEPLRERDHQSVSHLFRYSTYTHSHIDWRNLEEWLPSPAFVGWVAREGSEITSMLGATIHQPPSSPAVAWLRFMLPAWTTTQQRTLDGLWEALRDDLYERGVRQVALIIINGWVRSVASRWGFMETNAVVTLQRQGGPIPPPPEPPLSIHDVHGPAELDEVVRVDSAAFAPLWQYSRDTLAAARREAATFTRLERDGQTIGYQLSTGHSSNAHLARLAVLPGEQGRGSGGLLIGEMLRFFEARNVSLITVNTQEDNLRSQHLYRRLGFEFTGHRAPVLTVDL